MKHSVKPVFADTILIYRDKQFTKNRLSKSFLEKEIEGGDKIDMIVRSKALFSQISCFKVRFYDCKTFKNVLCIL